ncbi:hypothetical protein KP001_18410 [Geomonas subterranea]|uniref:Uncharacterized protein n=1 Tax=Geomonas subterranea TaxID=2847989 RepID=A0ABX8LG89_9BACT|nr:hypothetical protein [Geomonas subterranea]QXE90356.1 hypothetical protein KP001_18410 [Geomonas subterranea]QXM07516.1 hypothetical protein KP002_10880 [Geomonas subterranea]
MAILVLLLKCLTLYLVALVPLWRQLPGYDAYHIGNMAGYRVAGLSLTRVFFAETGFPIPMLSLSLQWDLFGNKLEKFQRCHVLFIATLTPLVYLFALGLTGSDSVALAAACLYGLSFSFPINLNWFVEPEHYELFFTLFGGSVAFYGASTGALPVVAAGGVLLGLSQLCKFPGLLSVWTLAYLCYGLLPGRDDMMIVAGCYAAPALLFVVVKLLLPKRPMQKVAAEGNFFARIFGYYYYRYRLDPKAYLKSMFSDRARDYSLQHLPLIFLAALFFFFGDPRAALLIGCAMLFLCLIFPLRMTLWYTQSLTVFLCIAAAYGMGIVVSAGSGLALILFTATVPLCGAAIVRYPYFKRLFLPSGSNASPLTDIAAFMARLLKPEESWLFNVNNGYSNVYLMAGRGFTGFFCHVLMGAYGPGKINLDLMPPNLYQEGADIVAAFCTSPPTYVVQSPHEYPILNLFYLEVACGVSYDIVDLSDNFVLYRLAPGVTPHPFDPDKYDARLLFDGEAGRRMMMSAVSTHHNRMALRAAAPR